MDSSSIMLDISLFLGLYFQIFMLVTFFEAEDAQIGIENRNPDILTTFPTVSIVIPCFNESRTVRKTMFSLAGLNYPKDKLSVLVVDDGSSDETFITAKKAATDLSDKNSPTYLPNIQVVRQKNGGKFTALNYGIKESTAEYVGCLDADSTVEQQALRRMIPYFNQQKVMAVTPAMRVETTPDKKMTFLQHIQRAEYNVGIFTKRIFGLLDAIHVTPGPFSIFRREVFGKIGFFKHAHNTEDMEIAFRIQSSGYRIANCHNAFVYTITPASLRKLYRQRTRWSYGFIKNIIDYKHILFKKKYGNMGMLTLPFAVIGIGFVFYFAGEFIYHTAIFIRDTMVRISVVGISWPHFSTHDMTASLSHSLKIFYITTDMTTFLALMLFLVTLYIVFKSKKMAEGSLKPSRDILYFVCFYSLLVPLWLGKAVYNVALSKKTPWR